MMSIPRELSKVLWWPAVLTCITVLLLLYLTSGVGNSQIDRKYSRQESEVVRVASVLPDVSRYTNLLPASTKPANDHSREIPLDPSTMSESAKRSTAGMPNVIFALADDLGWGDVEYNNGNAFTPNLNDMARGPNTVLLQRYYSGAPICSPTRGTVLTGRNHNRYCLWTANIGLNHPDFIKAQPMPLPLSEVTVAEVMREAGYSTALFGKWHLGDFKRLKHGNKKWPVSHPGLHGFDHWQATERSAPTCTINCGCFRDAECINGHYKDNPPCTNYYTNKSNSIVGWPEPIPEGDSHFIWSLAESYIKEQVNANKPFFLFLSFHAVHIRYIAAEHYKAMYQDKQYDSNQLDYYGAISEMDDVMGKLRKLLKEMGIHSNTLCGFPVTMDQRRGLQV